MDRACFGGSVRRALLAVVVTAGFAVAEEPAAKTPEQQLLATIRSETPEADKALAFKGLAVQGSPGCVADVATYLDNERLSSWARITLEAIPGEEASAALRAAAGPDTRLASRQLVGVINSLGVRRDTAAVPLLATRLGAGDPNVAAASAAALGSIGTPEAAAALARALAAGTSDRDPVAEACIVCGERRLAAGDQAGAVAMFDAVWMADVSEQRRAEGARGTILARGREGIPRLVELLQAPSKRLFSMALFTAREFASGPDRDAALAYEADLALLKSLADRRGEPMAGERKALVIDLLADRNVDGAGRAVQQAILDRLTDGEAVVRLAAIRAAGRCGDAAAADRLLETGAAGEPAVVEAIRQALATMPAEGVDDRVVARLDAAEAAALPLVVRLVGDRRILTATDRVLVLADHADASVRAAAIAALGSIVDPANLAPLARKAAVPRDDTEGMQAAAALREAAVRMPDRDACTATLCRGFKDADARVDVLIETLGDVGGPAALGVVASAAKSGDPKVQDVATKVLGKWMTADAAPVLLDLATGEAAGPYRGRALKGYVRIARQFVIPEAERAEMCRRALAAAEDPADRKGVIEILVRYPHAATLAVAKEATGIADVAEEAKAAVAAIEGKLARPAAGK